MAINDISVSQLLTTAAILLVVIGAYNALMTAIRYHRDEKTAKSKPFEELRNKVKAHDEMLTRDKERLDNIDEQSVIILRGVKAILSHEINGNSVDKMQQSMQEIDDFLIRRK